MVLSSATAGLSHRQINRESFKERRFEIAVFLGRRAGDRRSLKLERNSPLSRKLGQFYGVETKSLNRAVKRNADRFPKDFMFQISSREWENLKYQIGTSSSGHGGRRRPPYAFTEHGAIMAANVLNSPRAVQMNTTCGDAVG